MKPLDKYLKAIAEYPTPTKTTDIRAWFGLVNQVSHYNQLTQLMLPFKPFLSKHKKFEWSDEMDRIFEQSKVAIIDAIKEGVRIYDITKPTCLRLDWSNTGIGYFLSQKHCNCHSRISQDVVLVVGESYLQGHVSLSLLNLDMLLLRAKPLP